MEKKTLKKGACFALSVLTCGFLFCGVSRLTVSATAQTERFQAAYMPDFRSGNLKEITKPYLGVYECTQAKFGSKDVKSEFKSLTVELTSGGEFCLRYALKNGLRDERCCKYSYDEKTGEIILSPDFLPKEIFGKKNKVVLKDGTITAFIRFGRKNLVMKLTQK